MKPSAKTRYLVDAVLGQIRGPSGKVLGSLGKEGYLQFLIYGESCTRLVHRFIWESVNGQIPSGMQINHINGVKTDNRIENLELVTPKGNMRHAFRTGLVKRKLTPGQVTNIRERHARGEKQVSLMREFGVNQTNMSHIINHKFWSYL